MSTTNRRHGQDKTVLSCPCLWCEQNWRQDKTVFSSSQYIWDWTVANWKLGRAKNQDKTQTGSWVEKKQMYFLFTQYITTVDEWM